MRHPIRPNNRPPHPPVRRLGRRSRDLRTIDALLDHICFGAGAGSPVALHASAGEDTRPLVFLNSHAMGNRAGTGLALLGLASPEAPVLHVRIDIEERPSSCLEFNDRESRITRISPTRRVVVAGVEGRLTRVLVEGARPAWPVDAPYVLEFTGRNEEIGPRLAAAGLRPEIFIGVTDGCAMGGGNDPFMCVNRLHPECMSHNFAAGTRPTWVVTDHIQRATSTRFTDAFEQGHIYRSPHGATPVGLRAVARMSSKWGNSGTDGAWLFHCEYGLGGTT